MAVYALTRIEHGSEDGKVTTLEPGDSITKASGITEDQLKELVAAGAAGSQKPQTEEEIAEEAEAQADLEAKAAEADTLREKVAELEAELAKK